MAVPLLLELPMKPLTQEAGASPGRGKKLLVFSEGDVMVSRRIVPHEKTCAAIDALRSQKDRYSLGETVTQALEAVRYRHG